MMRRPASAVSILSLPAVIINALCFTLRPATPLFHSQFLNMFRYQLRGPLRPEALNCRTYVANSASDSIFDLGGSSGMPTSRPCLTVGGCAATALSLGCT
eukprot:325616-Amphidinium_carterae.1